MNDWMKFILKVIAFFLLMLFLFYLMDVYYKNINILLTTISTTLGYVIVILIKRKRLK